MNEMANPSPASGYKRIAVIGGGIAGLSAAFKLHELAEANESSIEFTVFEASNRAGGIIESSVVGECTLELGADSFITNKPWGIDLVCRLGLKDKIEKTSNQMRRTLVVRGNKLYPLPEGFRLVAPTDIPAFLSSPLLTPAGRVRVLLDLIIPRCKIDSKEEETVASFARRRLGVEALDRIVQPMIGGIYVGDVERLSLQATMPWLSSLESQYGSIIKGLTASRDEDAISGQGGDTDGGTHDGQDGGMCSGVRYGMFISLRGGLETLVDAIVAKLPGESVILNNGVRQIRCRNIEPHSGDGLQKSKPGFELLLDDGSTQRFDAVIMAVPAHQAAKLTAQLDIELSAELKKIESASSVILNLVYKRACIPHPLDGFGFVVPYCERRSIIACTFSSVKFAGRAPEDTVILRIFMGGSLQPHMVELEEQLLVKLAKRDLETLLGIIAEPGFVNVSKYINAMPQYVVGHQDNVQRIMKRLENFPGLAVAGNAYHGVGIPDCIHSGEIAAQKVLI